MFKKLLATVVITATMATSALADVVLVVPQKPGSGTTVGQKLWQKNLSLS